MSTSKDRPIWSKCSPTSVTIQETHEVPADDPVSEELDDPVASFAPTVKDTLGGKVAMPVPTMPEDMVSPRRPQRHLKERKVLEASPADSIPAAQPDFMSSASQDAKAEDVAPSQGTLVPVPAVPTVPSVPTVQKEVPEVEMEEMPAMSQHLDDGFRAGLRLLHTEELRRACLERGLDFQGSKGDLLNRLLGHFARAPPPTPTQDLGVACGRRRTQETKETILPPMENLKVNKDIRMADQQERPETGEHKYHKSEKKGKTEKAEKAEKTKTVKTVELKSKDSDSKAPKASHMEIPKEIQQLRPLEPTVKAPVLRTLLSRPRSTVQAAAPNFTALWRTMCPEVQKQTSTADAGRGTWMQFVLACTLTYFDFFTDVFLLSFLEMKCFLSFSDCFVLPYSWKSVKYLTYSYIFWYSAPLCRSRPFGGTSRSLQASWSFRHTSSTWSANWHLSCSNGGRWDIRLTLFVLVFVGFQCLVKPKCNYVPFLMTVEILKHCDISTNVTKDHKSIHCIVIAVPVGIFNLAL